VAAALTLLLPRQPEPQTPAPAADAARIQELEARLARLEELAARPVAAPASAASEVPRWRDDADPRADPHAVTPTILAQRLLALERRLEESQGRAPDPERAAAPAPRDGQQPVAAARRTILDKAASADAKLEAHRQLRRVRDAYTPDMVDELVRIATLDPRGEVRAAVWTFFDGSSHLPQLVPTLLRALVHDVDSRVREEAAETIGNYVKDDLGVVSALRQAAESDADPRVRAKAKRTLGDTR
jgi:hypothetical protein